MLMARAGIKTSGLMMLGRPTVGQDHGDDYKAKKEQEEQEHRAAVGQSKALSALLRYGGKTGDRVTWLTDNWVCIDQIAAEMNLDEEAVLKLVVLPVDGVYRHQIRFTKRSCYLRAVDQSKYRHEIIGNQYAGRCSSHVHYGASLVDCCLRHWNRYTRLSCDIPFACYVRRQVGFLGCLTVGEAHQLAGTGLGTCDSSGSGNVRRLHRCSSRRLDRSRGKRLLGQWHSWELYCGFYIGGGSSGHLLARPYKILQATIGHLRHIGKFCCMLGSHPLLVAGVCTSATSQARIEFGCSGGNVCGIGTRITLHYQSCRKFLTSNIGQLNRASVCFCSLGFVSQFEFGPDGILLSGQGHTLLGNITGTPRGGTLYALVCTSGMFGACETAQSKPDGTPRPLHLPSLAVVCKNFGTCHIHREPHYHTVHTHTRLVRRGIWNGIHCRCSGVAAFL